jgi:hypothetical protein
MPNLRQHFFCTKYKFLLVVQFLCATKKAQQGQGVMSQQQPKPGSVRMHGAARASPGRASGRVKMATSNNRERRDLKMCSRKRPTDEQRRSIIEKIRDIHTPDEVLDRVGRADERIAKEKLNRKPR